MYFFSPHLSYFHSEGHFVSPTHTEAEKKLEGVKLIDKDYILDA